MTEPSKLPYDRGVLVEILVYHYRVAPGKGCGCGWSKLGGSWPEHVVDVYEQSVAASRAVLTILRCPDLTCEWTYLAGQDAPAVVEAHLATHQPSATPSRSLAEAILDLHKPWYEVNGKRYESRVPVLREDLPAGWRPESHVCVVTGEGLEQPCEPGEEHQLEACAECRVADDEGNPAYLIWPCPTARGWQPWECARMVSR